MKKRNFIVVALLALVLSMAMTACGGGTSDTDEKDPVVTITSGTGNITTAQTYRLTYTTTNATKEQVTVSGGTYNETDKTFSATEAGEYTVTVKVTNIKKTAQASVKVNVTEAEPQPGEDTVAPEITFEEHGVLTVKVNTPITLPAAAATDDVDGDITDNLEVGADPQQGTAITGTGTGVYVFEAEAAGEYSISYYVQDEAENEAEEFLTVTVTPEIEETNVIAPEENKIENLAVSQKTFKENFEQGYNSPFLKKHSPEQVTKVYLSGDNDAISGNSMIMDFSEGTSGSNFRYWFGSFDQYIKSGRWTIEMDIKVIGGTPGGKFFLQFIYDGDNSGDNMDYTVNQDGITHIKYDYVKTFDPDKTWHFATFWMNNPSYENFKIAIDNIQITWKEVVDATYVHENDADEITAEDLDGEGVTLNLSGTKYTALSGSGRYVATDKLVSGDILTAEQAENITAENGFGECAIYMTTQINNFLAFDRLCTDPAYNYTLTVKAYSAVSSQWMFFFTNAAGAQTGNSNGLSGTGVQIWSKTFIGNEGYIHAGMYSSPISPVLIGEISLRRELKQATDKTPNGNEVGAKWTYDYSTVKPLSEEKFTTVNTSEVAELAGLEGFGEKCLQFDHEANFTAELLRASLGGAENKAIMEAEGKYKITLWMYVVRADDIIHLRLDGNFPTAATAGTQGFVKAEIDFDGAADFISIYSAAGGGSNFYLGKMEIELIGLK